MAPGISQLSCFRGLPAGSLDSAPPAHGYNDCTTTGLHLPALTWVLYTFTSQKSLPPRSPGNQPAFDLQLPAVPPLLSVPSPLCYLIVFQV